MRGDHGIKVITIQEQILMGLASIKFRQPIEINYGKKCAKRKKATGL